MVSKPQKQQRDGNYLLRQTLSDSDILNYFSKGSGYFCMGGKDINCHMTVHFIYTQCSTKITYYCQKMHKVHISQNCHHKSGRTDPTVVLRRQNLVFSVSCQQQDCQSIDGQKTELPKNENGSEMHTANKHEPLYST